MLVVTHYPAIRQQRKGYFTVRAGFPQLRLRYRRRRIMDCFNTVFAHGRIWTGTGGADSHSKTTADRGRRALEILSALCF